MKNVLVIAVTLVAIVGIGVFALFDVKSDLREQQHIRHFTTVGRAVLEYEAIFNQFPQSDHHSWRVKVLSRFSNTPIIGQYDYASDWDSQGNIEVTSKYGCPEEYCADKNGLTPFMMIVGRRTATQVGSVDSDSKQNTESIIIIAESQLSPVVWTAPKDMVFNDDSASGQFLTPFPSSKHRIGPLVMFGDGAVFRLSKQIPTEVLRSLVAIDTDKRPSRDAMKQKGWITAVD